MTRQDVEDFIGADTTETIMLLDGDDEAFVGITYDAPRQAVYSVDVILQMLQEEGLSEEEAIEHFEYNIIGSKFAEGTPIFMRSIKE